MKRWNDPGYQRIKSAELSNNNLHVTFQNGDRVTITKESFEPANSKDIAWEQLSFTPFEILVPASPTKLEILWDSIRVLTDVEFSQFLATKAEEEAKKVGQRLKSLRERKGIKASDLAEKSGVTPQTISRIENGRTDVGFATLKKILVAMGYTLKDLAIAEIEANRVVEKRSLPLLFKKLAKIGIDTNLIARKIIPKRIQDALLNYKDQAPELLVNEALSYLSAIYKWSPEKIWDDPNLTIGPSPAQFAFFKKTTNANLNQINAYSHYAYYLSTVVLKGYVPKQTIEYPASIEEFKTLYFERYDKIDLTNVLNLVWDLGIAILPLSDSGVFHGASWNIEGRHVIVLKQINQSHARWIFDLLHELYHVFVHLENENTSVIETEELSPIKSNESVEELEANSFANQVVFGNKAEEIAEKCVAAAKWDIRGLSKSVSQIAKRENIREDFIANYLAFRLSIQGENWWATANKLQITDPDPFRIAANILQQRVNVQNLNPIDCNLLLTALTN